MINCIIFDCDGTLVDSEYLCSLGLEITLGDYGVEANALEMMAKFQGAKLGWIIEQLGLEHQVKFDDDFISAYRRVVDGLFEEQLKPCDGVAEILEDIQLSICVASSGPPQKIHKALSLTGLLKYFEGRLFSSYDINSWKPDPGVFIHAAKQMGFPANQCAVVEDSPVGIAAARSAGMMPIHYDPLDAHSLIEGVQRIAHMRELKRIVSSLSRE